MAISKTLQHYARDSVAGKFMVAKKERDMYDTASITRVIDEFGITDSEVINDLLWSATAYPFAPGSEVAQTLRELFQRMAEGATPEQLIEEAHEATDRAVEEYYEANP